MNSAAERKVYLEVEGEQRSLRVLNKSMQAWMKEPNAAGLPSLKRCLTASRNAMLKNTLVTRALKERISGWQEKSDALAGRGDALQKTLTESLEKMKEAKEYRNNKQQYAVLASMIKRHPKKEVAEKRLQQLRAEIEEAKKVKRDLEIKLSLKKKNLQVLALSMRELDRSLDLSDMTSEME